MSILDQMLIPRCNSEAILRLVGDQWYDACFNGGTADW